MSSPPVLRNFISSGELVGFDHFVRGVEGVLQGNQVFAGFERVVTPVKGVTSSAHYWMVPVNAVSLGMYASFRFSVCQPVHVASLLTAAGQLKAS